MTTWSMQVFPWCSSGAPPKAPAGRSTSTAVGAAAAEPLLAAHPDLDVIFIASDLMASGALGLLASRGIAVPGRIAVVGYDDLGVAASTSPALTTVSSPVVEMARTAGRLLLEQMAGGAIHGDPVIFTPTLVAQDSS